MISVAVVAVCSKTQKRLFVDAESEYYDNSDVERDESTVESIDSDDIDVDNVDFEIKAIVKSSQEPLGDDQKGSFHCIFFYQGRYWERLLKVFSEDVDSSADTVRWNFWGHTCGKWDFPKRKDTKISKAKYVFYGPCKPSDISKGGYALDDSKCVQIYNKLKWY